MSDLKFVVKFKDETQSIEFQKVDIRVKAIIFYAAFEMKKDYDYDIVVTSVFRTESEQKLLIKQGKPAVKNSAHSEYRATDVRIKDFPNQNWIHHLEDKINFFFPRTDGFKTALVHGEGNNRHLHIQVPRDKKF